MAKLSRRDMLIYLLLAGGVVATANPNIVQGILDRFAPPTPPIAYRPMVLGESDEPHTTQGATAAATMQATEQGTEPATESAELTVTPPTDQPTKAP